MTKKRLARLALGLAVLAAAVYGWLRLAPRHVPAGQTAMATLSADSLSELHDAFNASEGKVRILAMLSPT